MLVLYWCTLPMVCFMHCTGYIVRSGQSLYWQK